MVTYEESQAEYWSSIGYDEADPVKAYIQEYGYKVNADGDVE
jgi:hypothetical protein